MHILLQGCKEINVHFRYSAESHECVKRNMTATNDRQLKQFALCWQIMLLRMQGWWEWHPYYMLPFSIFVPSSHLVYVGKIWNYLYITLWVLNIHHVVTLSTSSSGAGCRFRNWVRWRRTEEAGGSWWNWHRTPTSAEPMALDDDDDDDDDIVTRSLNQLSVSVHWMLRRKKRGNWSSLLCVLFNGFQS